ncbi:MAG: hypothetical protein M1490_01525 [Candidatus Bathyarchaeota archaeon]|nr:hypothetical protein [Candidatus Bathyarchaeota archaeon]
MGGAEVSHVTSSLYKQKVVELLELDGYVLVKSSSDVSMTPDLIFRKPESEGKTDIYVESKYADVSIGDADFLEEFAKYLVMYESERVEPFDFYLFFRKCKNSAKWKQIFSAQHYDEDICQAFFKAILENEKLNDDIKHKVEENGFVVFKKFVADTYVNQINYDTLLMKIEEKQRKGTSGYDYYLRELPPIKQKQKIIGNFVQIKKYLGEIYSWELRDGIDYETIHNTIEEYEPICLKGCKLYSLENVSNRLNDFIKVSTIQSIRPLDYIPKDKNGQSILQTLYKKYFLKLGVAKKNCCYVNYPNEDILYFAHKNSSEEIQKIEGKQVSRLFKDTLSPFVRHEAIEIEVRVYDNQLFIFFNPTVLFSDKNKELITGEGVKTLYEKFSPNRYDNNTSIFGDMSWWFDFLCGKGKTSFETSDLLSFMSELSPPEDSQQRNDVIATERLEKFL